MVFQEKLRKWLEMRFGSITKAAELLEYPASSISRYLIKKENTPRPGYDFYVRLRKFGCDLNWLLDESSPSENIVSDSHEIYRANDPVNRAALLEQENRELKKIIKKIKQLIEQH